MKTGEIAAFPPILQLVALGLLGIYVALSVAARLVPSLDWLWDNARRAKGGWHFTQYTLVPALVLAAAGTAVLLNWNAAAPLDGGWTTLELTLAPASLLLGGAVIFLAKEAGARIDTSDATSGRAFIPLLLMLAGIGLIAFGAITLGRTVKRHRVLSRSTALDQRPPAGGAGAPRFQIDSIAAS